MTPAIDPKQKIRKNVGFKKKRSKHVDLVDFVRYGCWRPLDTDKTSLKADREVGRVGRDERHRWNSAERDERHRWNSAGIRKID